MNTRKEHNRTSTISEIFNFLLISYTFTWLVWFPGILATKGILGDIPWPPLFGIGACGPLLAALWLTHKEGGWRAVRAWLRAGFLNRVKPIWWALIGFLPFIVPALALWLNKTSGGATARLVVLDNPLMVLPAMLLMLSIGGAQEEYGWRGYLLPRLDGIQKTWQSDLMMILLHSCWHIPLFAISYTLQSQYSFWLFLAFGIGFTFLINLIYRRTNMSILAALVFHGLVNTGLEIFPPVGPAVAGSPLPLLFISGLFGLVAFGLSLILPSSRSFTSKD